MLDLPQIGSTSAIVLIGVYLQLQSVKKAMAGLRRYVRRVEERLMRHEQHDHEKFAQIEALIRRAPTVYPHRHHEAHL